MASSSSHYSSSSSSSFAPSAPTLPDSYTNNNPPHPPPVHGYGGGGGQQPYQYQYQYHPQYQHQHAPGGGGQFSNFPSGTHPDVIRSFEMVDRDRSGFIDEYELQTALSYQYQRFSLKTIRLLMFLFKNPNDSSGFRIGPHEFAALWSCLGHWRGIFERFDRDRSGKIDLMELRDALYSLGYAIPPSVLKLLITKYDDGSGRKNELNFDSFVECGMIVKGLTEKFKEKDRNYTGSATLSYDSFMSMVIPFLVQYD